MPDLNISSNYLYNSSNSNLGTQQELFRWMNSSFTSSSYSSSQLVTRSIVDSNTSNFDMYVESNLLIPKKKFYRSVGFILDPNTRKYYNSVHEFNPTDGYTHRYIDAIEMLVYNNGSTSTARANYNFYISSSDASNIYGPGPTKFFLWGQWENNSSNDGIIVRFNIGVTPITGTSFPYGYLPLVIHGTGIKKIIVRYGNSGSYNAGSYTITNVPDMYSVPASGTLATIPSNANGGGEIKITSYKYIQIDCYLKCWKSTEIKIVM